LPRRDDSDEYANGTGCNDGAAAGIPHSVSAAQNSNKSLSM
jgi:hypothetical protein